MSPPSGDPGGVVARAVHRSFGLSAARGALVLVAACGGSWESATELPSAPRRPDGVALEPPAAMPAPVERADAHGVIALREPVSDEDVEEIVRAYFHAFERADERALVELLSPSATSLGRQGGSRQQLIESWRSKVKTFEHRRLAGVEIARISRLELHTYETLGLLGAPMRPAEMRPGDLYVRVPIAAPRIGSEPLFGDVLILMLRHEGGRLKIVGQADENAS